MDTPLLVLAYPGGPRPRGNRRHTKIATEPAHSDALNFCSCQNCIMRTCRSSENNSIYVEPTMAVPWSTLHCHSDSDSDGGL